MLPAFWRSWLLTFFYLSNKVRSTTPWIFSFAGFLTVYDLETLRIGALFAYSLSCGSPTIISALEVLPLIVLYDILRGFSRSLTAAITGKYFPCIQSIFRLALFFRSDFWTIEFLIVGVLSPRTYIILREFPTHLAQDCSVHTLRQTLDFIGFRTSAGFLIMARLQLPHLLVGRVWSPKTIKYFVCPWRATVTGSLSSLLLSDKGINIEY